MVIIAPRQYNITTWHYIIFFSHASILFYFILLLFNDYISRRAPLDAKILFHHTLADGVIKVLVLSKSVQGEVPINLVQRSEQGSNELHATDPAKQIGCGLVACGVIGLESDLQISKLELNILGVEETVDLAQKLGALGGQSTMLLQLF
jgi:hypothetical protein